MSTKLAILVGLCQVSPNAYGGWDGVNGCEGCELDVENVEKILTPLGYTIQTLKTADATKTAILSTLETTAQTLTAGDTLVFYFAGHGGQQPDPTDDEDDGRDETLLAYDGEIIDDELNAIWLKLQRDVRVVMLSDSCNSGTNYRNIRDVFTPTPIQPLSRSVRSVMMGATHSHGRLPRWFYFQRLSIRRGLYDGAGQCVAGWGLCWQLQRSL
jgi:metacaspase-1